MRFRTCPIVRKRRWPLLLLLLLAGALLVPSSLPPAEAQFAWEVQAIEAGVRATGATSLALDSEGRPHVAYTDLARGMVAYARWNGVQWVNETAAQDGFPLGMVSLALDTRDLPHISYFDARERVIKYANFDGFAWRVLTVDRSHFEGYSSIALDPEATPHIAYVLSTGKLRMARLAGSVWTLENADPDVVIARYPSLAFNSIGRPQIAYTGNGMLLHAEWIGYRWIIEVVDEETSPEFVSMRLDASDVPNIGYRNSIQRELRFAWRETGAWHRVVVDTLGDVGWDAGLALDMSGNPHLSYYDRDQSLLKYSYRAQDVWFTRVVDQTGVVGWWSSVAIGIDGRPHFAYYSWTDRTVRYAIGEFALGIRTWAARDVTPTSALLVGEVTSLGDASQLDVFFEYRVSGGNWSRQDGGVVANLGFIMAPLDDLQPETLYEYRAVGFVEGLEIRGDVFPFATPPVPLPEPVVPLSAVLAGAAASIAAILIAYAVVQWRRRVRETPRVGRPKGLYAPDSREGEKNP